MILDTDNNELPPSKQAAKKAQAPKRRKLKLIALLILITAIAGGTTYGLSRPGVMTAVRSAIRYASPDVQKKAWNEAQREVLEAEIKGRQDKLDEVKPQSFWRPEIINTANAQELPQTEAQSESTGTAPEKTSPAPKKLDPAGTTPKQDSKQYSVESSYILYAQMAAAAGLSDGQTALLKRIGECESGFIMQPNHGGHSSAYGIFQLLKVHDKRGNRMTAEGNIKIAIELFKEQGTTPWNASKACWGKK